MNTKLNSLFFFDKTHFTWSLFGVNKSLHTHKWVMSIIAMSHVTYTNESCHSCEHVVAHAWMSDVTHMNESWHTYEWVMSHIWMSHCTHTNESCHTSEWVMAHIWMSHGTHLNESWHTYEWVKFHVRFIGSYTKHIDTCVNASCDSVNHTRETLLHMWMGRGMHTRNTVFTSNPISVDGSCDSNATKPYVTYVTMWHDSFISCSYDSRNAVTPQHL